MGTYQSLVSTALFLLLTVFTEVCKAGSYCHFLHEDYYVYRTVYCEGGCCSDYGEDDEICCFSWTVGIILGIAFGCVGFIAMIIVALICCHQMKKRSGHVIHPQAPQNNTVVYTAPTAPPYPYPQLQAQPAYYPGTHYSAQPGTAPPPYTAGTQPAYMPTQLNQPGSGGNGNKNMQTTNMSNDPAYPPTQQQLYNGYGTGQTAQSGP